MNEDSKLKVLMEQHNLELKAINEYVKKIPKIEEKLDGIFDAVGELKVDVNILKTEMKEVKADIKAIKGRLNQIDSRLTKLELDSYGNREAQKELKAHLLSIEEELAEIRNEIKTKPEKEAVKLLEKRVIFLERKLKV